MGKTDPALPVNGLSNDFLFVVKRVLVFWNE